MCRFLNRLPRGGDPGSPGRNLFQVQGVERLLNWRWMYREMINIPLREWSALVLLLMLVPGSPVFADPGSRVLESGQEKVALLELYTSEGCSSCPPADAFVSSLKDSGLYPKQVIPLSFHVTYWDYIGWNDPYAQKLFDQRQRQVAARQKSPTIYTPQLVLDGRDVRGSGGLQARVRELNERQPQANIKLALNTPAAGALGLDLDILVADKQLRANSAVFIALFENRLTSQVRAGENSGKTLRHEYVVRQLVGPLSLADANAESHHSVEIEIPETVKRENAGVVAFVQNTVDGSVLQALSVHLVVGAPVSGSGQDL